MNSKAAKKLRQAAKKDAARHDIPEKWLYQQMKAAYHKAKR